MLLFVALFVLGFDANAQNNKVIINEIQTSGASSDDEFIELYNTGDSAVDISTWSIQYKGGTGTSYYKKNFVNGNKIPAKGYFLIAHGGSGNYSGATPYDMSWSQSLSSAGGIIFLVDDQVLLNSSVKTSIVDKVAYGLAGEYEILPARSPADGKSIERKNFQDTDNYNEDFNFSDIPTPHPSGCNSDPEKCKTEEIKKEYSMRISINEIFTTPLTNSELEEFVELYSSSNKVENLEGWYLKDRAGKTCALTGEIIDPAVSRFLTLKNNADKKCTLALNDTQGEFLGLYNPTDADAVFSVSYDGSAKKGRSYNFDGSSWSWSQFLTEGKENIFNSEPYGKIKIDDDVFADVYADFFVSTGDGDGDKIKISWEFGDGHGSSLAKTRHKYENVGTYNGSVKLSDGSVDVLQNFIVEVKKFPRPEIKIIAINANPAGADTGVEHITVQNKSKNKINLKGWSIATGWEDFINHPIREDVIIKKNKSKEIMSDVSSFTLNNTKAKIQLRYPDGKVAYEVKYKKVKGIKEGEVYEKIKSGWRWMGGEKAESHQSSAIGNQKETSIASSVVSHLSSEIQNIDKSNYEEVIVSVEVDRENKLILASNDSIRIELLKSVPRLNETQAVREIDGIYFFTSEVPRKEHYAVVFLKNIFSKINSRLNMLLNYFF